MQGAHNVSKVKLTTSFKFMRGDTAVVHKPISFGFILS